MGKIVAIGGGELKEGETLAIDQYIVRLSEKKNPRLLFLPTASQDAKGYIETVTQTYSKLGCQVNSLCLVSHHNSDEEIQNKIFSSDIIYVGGGDTEDMMKIWHKYHVDCYLKEAYRRNIILSGLSAGAICWFIAGYSDSEFIAGSSDPHFKWVKGLGLLPYLHCPHYNEENRHDFDSFYQGQITDAIALDNNTAFCECNGVYSIIKSDPLANAYHLCLTEGKLTKTILK